MSQQLWTVRQAAENLETTAEYVRQLLNRKKLFRTKKGTRTMIDPALPENIPYIEQRRETIAASN